MKQGQQPGRLRQRRVDPIERQACAPIVTKIFRTIAFVVSGIGQTGPNRKIIQASPVCSD
jgi:hypothetical protein